MRACHMKASHKARNILVCHSKKLSVTATSVLLTIVGRVLIEDKALSLNCWQSYFSLLSVCLHLLQKTVDQPKA